MLLFLDGQAHYDSTRIGLKYTTVDPTNVVWSVAAEGRFGNCIKRASTSVNTFGYLSIAPLVTRLGPWSPQTSGVCGFAVKVDDLKQVSPENIISPDGHEFFTVMEGASCHVALVLNPDGTFSLWRSRFTSSTDLLAVSAEGLQSGAWAYIECKWFIDEVAGNFQLRANGVEILNFTGNTQDSRYLDTLGVWNSVHLLSVESASLTPLVLRMCDLYLADLTAPDPDDVHDFLGDGVVDTILPNEVGASSGWTSSGGPNWDTQNDSPAPDDDATYVRAVTLGTRDLYQFEDIPPGSVVKGVQVCVLARKEEEGASAIAPVVQPGATPQLGTTQGVATITYDRFITAPWDVNPETLAPWTDADINNGQFGVQKMI